MPSINFNAFSKLLEHSYNYGKANIQRWQDAMNKIDKVNEEYKFENLVRDVTGSLSDAVSYTLAIPGLVGGDGSPVATFVVAVDADVADPVEVRIPMGTTAADFEKDDLKDLTNTHTIPKQKMSLVVENAMLTIRFKDLRTPAGGGNPVNLNPGQYLGVVRRKGTNFGVTIHFVVV